jgi:hypothetical protein
MHNKLVIERNGNEQFWYADYIKNWTTNLYQWIEKNYRLFKYKIIIKKFIKKS